MPMVYNISNNAWHHLVINFTQQNGTDIVAQVYLDGVASAQNTFYSSTLTQVSTWLTVGENIYGGAIDDLRLYSINLGESSILDLFNE